MQTLERFLLSISGSQVVTVTELGISRKGNKKLVVSELYDCGTDLCGWGDVVSYCTYLVVSPQGDILHFETEDTSYSY